jgi:hypothetical protein
MKEEAQFPTPMMATRTLSLNESSLFLFLEFAVGIDGALDDREHGQDQHNVDRIGQHVEEEPQGEQDDALRPAQEADLARV